MNVIGTVWVPRDAEREERVRLVLERMLLDPRVVSEAEVKVNRANAVATTAGGDKLKLFIKEKP